MQHFFFMVMVRLALASALAISVTTLASCGNTTRLHATDGNTATERSARGKAEYSVPEVRSVLWRSGFAVRVFRRQTDKSLSGDVAVVQAFLADEQYRDVRALVADYRKRGVSWTVGSQLRVWVMRSARTADRFLVKAPGRFQQGNIVAVTQTRSTLEKVRRALSTLR